MSGVMQQISIVIADDHPFYRDGLKNIISLNPSFKVVGEASDGLELVQLVKALQPDVIITDISMPNKTGIEAVKKIISLKLPTKAIALTMHSEDEIILQMLDAGAMGYLDKNTSKDELYQAIESVVIHDKVFFPEATRQHMYKLLTESSYKPYPNKNISFSEREIEIIKLICLENKSKDIAEKLEISTRTVESHRERIMERMDVRTTAGLVAYAFSHQIVSF